MNPPIFEWCKNDPAIVAFFQAGSDAPLRVYAADFAGDNPQKPYATWRSWGVPKNSISDTPSTDYLQAQIDVYDDDADVVDQGIKLMRDMIEEHGEITSWWGLGRDAATGNIYSSFDCWLSVKR